METAEAKPGRRERARHEKHERIFRAASELFAEGGFEAVTTQQISDRADVAAGTLFRYAASKRELLLMVYNEEFRAALHDGTARAAREAEPAGAIMALVEPTVTRAQEHAENSVAYQRELLFGPAGEQYRAEGLALVARLEAAIGAEIARTASARGITASGDAIRVASSSVFAAMHLAIARLSTGAHEGADVSADLRLQIAQIVAGALAIPVPGGPRAQTVESDYEEPHEEEEVER